MAITRVAGLSDWDLGGADLVLALSGAGYAADDFAIIVAKSSAVAVDPVLSLSGTSGWTAVRNDLEVGGQDKKCYVWTKKLTGSETDVTVESDQALEVTALMEIFRGVDTTTAFDATEVENAETNTALPTNPAITTVTDNAAVVLYNGQVQGGNTTVYVAPDGYTLGVNLDAVDNTDQELPSAFAYLLDTGTAGVKTPGAWQNSLGGAGADNIGYTFALRPAAGGDVTPPTLSVPFADDITSTTMVPKCTTDEGNGTMYMVVVPNGDVPSVAQIKAGQQSNGSAATASDSDSITSVGEHTFATITGLTLDTEYELYFVQTDAAANDSTAATIGFTTASTVNIINSDIDVDPTLVAAPGAGNSRASYYAVGVSNIGVVNGQFSCTAISVGGQTGTLIGVVKAPGGVYREGVSVAVFEFLEAKIALMSDGVITPTWGDVDGEPLYKKYSQITFSDVDQTTPRGSNTVYNNDTTQLTWAPGNVRGIADGMVYAASSLGGNPVYDFDTLAETLELGANSHKLLVGTIATTDGSNISLNLTASGTMRPNTVLGFVVNPIDVVSPVLTSPLANDIGTSTVTPSVVTSEEYGDLYYVVVPDGDAPSSAQIIAGNDSTNSAAISADSISPPVIGTNTFDEVIGLSNGISYEIAFAHEDAAGNISAPVYIGFTTGAANTPDITTAPTIDSESTTAYTVDLGEVTEDGTAYLGVYLGNETPTAAQIKAGTGARGVASKAHTANTPIGTQVLTPTDSPVFPYYHIKIVYESAAGFSSVVTIEAFLDAPTGKQYILMGAGPYADWMDEATPAPEEGDVLIWDLVSIEDNYDFEVSDDGNYILYVDDDTSRQSAERELWRIGDQSFSGEQLFYVNNQPPTIGGGALTALQRYVNIEAAPVDFDLLFTDFEDDVLVIDQSPDDTESLPDGITFVANELITDETALVVGVYTILVRATDVTGDYSEEFLEIFVFSEEDYNPNEIDGMSEEEFFRRRRLYKRGIIGLRV